MKRYKMRRKSSKRLFSNTASRVDSRNINTSPMRGGYRF